LFWLYCVKVLLILVFWCLVLCVFGYVLYEGLFFFVYWGFVMFGSNVEPRVKKKLVLREPWLCMKCSVENAHYMSKCKGCGERRPH